MLQQINLTDRSLSERSQEQKLYTRIFHFYQIIIIIKSRQNPSMMLECRMAAAHIGFGVSVYSPVELSAGYTSGFCLENSSNYIYSVYTYLKVYYI